MVRYSESRFERRLKERRAKKTAEEAREAMQAAGVTEDRRNGDRRAQETSGGDLDRRLRKALGDKVGDRRRR